jgi:hypothetical protein
MMSLKQRLLALSFTLVILHCSHQRSWAQSDSSYIGLWTIDVQPLALLEPRVGGIKVGAEYAILDKLAFHSDFCFRIVPNRSALITLTPGEKDAMYGFQIQPSLKWYVGRNDQRKNFYAKQLCNSFEFKAGYGRYYNDVESWFGLIDGQGNRYEKLLGYTRRQNNFDFSILFNTRVYFKNENDNMGIEFFFGLGARVKSFKYTKFSPELDMQSIALTNQNRSLGLNQDGTYPLLPMGIKFFFIIE